MTQHDILRVSRALRDDMRLETLYNLICDYGDEKAAIWLENGKEQTLTFRDYARLTRNYADCIRSAVAAPAGAYVAGLDAAGRARLREQCHRLAPAAPFVVEAAAWAARAVV